jgi:serine phosphatase RsbU (regulator of sigma subunit)
MPEVLANAAAGIGATDLVAYLVDFGQSVLEPLPDRSAHLDLPVAEPVGASMAGKAYTDQRVVTAERDDGVRVWIPLLEGSDRTGVVALTLPEATEELLRCCEEIGILAGYLIASQARCTDMYNLHRRRHSMSLAASMQWDLLPPLVLDTGAVSLAGLIEPAYDVGGDCFDYAVNGPIFDFAVMDAMGHGVGSAVIASLAMGCYRHDRRESRTLAAMHVHLAETISSWFGDMSFATGALCRLNQDVGELTWTNAGHPLPLLIRGGRVVGELQCKPTPPWGTLAAEPMVATEQLDPGDCLLLYTDGVTEARTPDGEEFGVERLMDLAQRHASDLLQPETVVRLIVESVREHQNTELLDDATVVLVRWDGPGT